jgi:hypothetical protein
MEGVLQRVVGENLRAYTVSPEKHSPTRSAFTAPTWAASNAANAT